MKKSMITVLSTAMALSMFSSVTWGANAAGKTSNDFIDLGGLDAATKAKFDAMIGAGIFNGVKDDTFGLNENMNRAQFAKVAALVFNLKLDAASDTSIFSDVNAKDPANGYAVSYINAIVKAGITNGTAPGMYDPAGQVTKEQLAAFLIRGLGLESEVQKNAALTDNTVSDWAKGYVALALENKLMSNEADGTFGGTNPASRKLLATASYEAKQLFDSTHFDGKYAIASFKAVDANVFTVQLNGAVTDLAAVKLSLTKNGIPVTEGFTLKWSDDKKTATFTFNSKFDQATWNVALSGLASIDDAKKSAQLETAKEQISKIEFSTQGEVLPNSNKIRVDFNATNQYGKKSNLSASDFIITTSMGKITSIGGEQAFYLALPDDTKRDDRIGLTIIHEASMAQVSKTYSVGDKRIITKLEVGNLLNDSGNAIDAVAAENYAYLDLKAYDQYGFRVEDKEELNDGITVVIPDSALKGGNDGAAGAFVDNAVGDNAADLKLRSVSDKTEDLSVVLFANGSVQSITKPVKVIASKVPASIEFGAYNYNLAKEDAPTGDEDVDGKFYVPIIVKDAQGTILTPQEIYDKRDKLEVFSSNGITLADDPISNSGIHKGMIAIAGVKSKDTATITVQLDDNQNVRKEMTLNIREARKADDIRFSTTPAKYMIADTDNEMKVKLFDQYGEEMKYDKNSEYVVRYSLKANAGDPATLAATSLSSTQRVDAANAQSARKYVMQPKAAGEEVIKDFTLSQNSLDTSVDSLFDKSFKFYTGAAAKSASYSFKATLYRADKKGTVVINGSNYAEVDVLSTTMEVLDPNDVNNKLTYEAYLDKSNNSLLAADDYIASGTGITGASFMYDNYKGFAKEVKVRAVNAKGDIVKVPTNIVSVSSSDSQIAEVGSRSADAKGALWVAGGKTGSAKLTVLFTDGKKNISNAIIDITTKNEGPVVNSIVLDKSGKDVSRTDLANGLYLWDAKLAEKIVVKDQYADEFVAKHAPGSLDEEAVLNKSDLIKANGAGYNANDLLKLSYYISNVVGTNPSAVSVDAKTGMIQYNGAAGDVTSFKVNVVAPSGMSAAFDINVK